MQRVARILLRIMIIGLVAMIVILPFHAFISTWGGTEIGPLLVWKSWKEILLLVMVPLVAVYLYIRRDMWHLMWGRWINKLILLYVIMSLVFTFTSDASWQAAFAGAAMNVRYFAIFLLAQLVAVSGHPWIVYLKKWLSPWLLTTTVLVCILGIVQVSFVDKNFLIQFGYDKFQTIAPYVLLDETEGALRAFSTLSGPNDLGAYLLLPLALAAMLVWRNKRDVLALSTLCIGMFTLFLTGSRSAWIGAMVMLLVVMAQYVPRERLLQWTKWGAVPIAIGVMFFVWLATTVPALRLIIFHSSPGDAHVFEGSTQEHWDATARGVVNMFYHPFGQGLGVAGPASFYNTNAEPMIPENYFVQIGQEIGWYGLALFIAINVAIAMQLWRRRTEFLPRALLASFAGLSVIGLFLHVWADDPTAMTWWAIAGLVVFSPHAKKQGKERKK